MFDPRKLKPPSMEFCSAPTAVMTEITEKTPMVIPIIVRAARNLFAPNELSAIFMISRNNMTIFTCSGCDGQRPPPQANSSYSYLSAVTGSRRDALQAGANPENNPVITETIMLAETSPKEKWTGKEGKALPIPKHIT